MGEDDAHRWWVLDVLRGQWDTGSVQSIIKSTADVDGHDVVVGVEQEGGSGGKESAETTVRNLAGFAVEVVHPTGDKTTRAVPFSSQVNNGNVFLAKGDWNREFLNELKFFPNSKYKDQVDAVSGAFSVMNFVGSRIGVV
jgi:predicted phage terminase large subunit-like protein